LSAESDILSPDYLLNEDAKTGRSAEGNPAMVRLSSAPALCGAPDTTHTANARTAIILIIHPSR